MVRQRDNYSCQVCGYFSERYVAAHHIIRRGIKATRLEPFNGVALCPSHHTFSHEFSAHKTPEAFLRWFKKQYSLRWELIRRKSRTKMTERQAIEEFTALTEAE